ncbi:hypothetical protein TRVL_06495 [Trypanosoma vivax]|nr:hypothetical protein TRVL_06495 [Trypanosoma vivax]
MSLSSALLSFCVPIVAWNALMTFSMRAGVPSLGVPLFFVLLERNCFSSAVSAAATWDFFTAFELLVSGLIIVTFPLTSMATYSVVAALMWRSAPMSSASHPPALVPSLILSVPMLVAAHGEVPSFGLPCLFS